jgi:hypothetical protein
MLIVMFFFVFFLIFFFFFIQIAILLDAVERWYKALSSGQPPPLPDAPFLKATNQQAAAKKKPKKETSPTPQSLHTSVDSTSTATSAGDVAPNPRVITPSDSSKPITSTPSKIGVEGSLPTGSTDAQPQQNPPVQVFDLFDVSNNPLRLDEHLTINGKEFIPCFVCIYYYSYYYYLLLFIII